MAALTAIKTEVILYRFFFNDGVDKSGSFLKALERQLALNLIAHNGLLFWDRFHV